jgi:hypothetical protein
MPSRGVRPRRAKVGGTGVELPQENTGNTEIRNQSGAESGALGAREAPLDPDLLAVVDAWPALPESVKAGILAMIRATPQVPRLASSGDQVTNDGGGQ